jgi:hypothetical protein
MVGGLLDPDADAVLLDEFLGPEFRPLLGVTLLVVENPVQVEVALIRLSAGRVWIGERDPPVRRGTWPRL